MEKLPVFISFDIEDAGKGDPEDRSVVNMGFVAYTRDPITGQRTRLGHLSMNMVPQKSDPDTLKWWHSTPELAATFASFQQNAKQPADAMQDIRSWITSACAGHGPATMVAMPTIYDGSLLYAYWFRFLGHPSGGKGPGFTMMDVRSYGAGKLGVSYADANKTRAFKPYMPSAEQAQHTHTGVDDAEEQLILLFNLMDKK